MLTSLWKNSNTNFLNILILLSLPVIVLGGEEDVTGLWEPVEVGVEVSVRDVFSCVVCDVDGAAGGVGGVGTGRLAGGGGGEGSADIMAASSTSCSSIVMISWPASFTFFITIPVTEILMPFVLTGVSKKIPCRIPF